MLGFHLRPAQGAFLAEHWWQYVFYFQEWAYAEAGHSVQSMPFTQSWSLGIEEKFYLVWPALAFCALGGPPPLAGADRVGAPRRRLGRPAWYLEPAGFPQLIRCLDALRANPRRLRPGAVG